MPNPQAGGPPLVVCPRLLIQYIRSYPPTGGRPYLPQPEDDSYWPMKLINFAVLSDLYNREK
jgi:hypothetical protein